MMIETHQKNETLDQILKSKTFSESSTYQKLLRYLVESSIKGVSPKEKEIAIDVFGKDESFDPFEDTLVRVYIYKLRKKLDSYYKGEGKNDKIRLSIPKGHYHVEFFKYSSPFLKIKNRLQHPAFLLLFPMLFIFFVTTLFFGYKYYANPVGKLKPYQPIWSDFLNNDSPTIIVLGDRFTFDEELGQLDNRGRRIRDETINSMEELELYEKNYLTENDTIGMPSHGNLPLCSAWCLSELLPIFFESKSEFVIKLCSNIEWGDLSQNNMIYIGDFRSLKIFQHFYEDLKIKYQSFPDKIYLTNDLGDTLTTYPKIDSPAGFLHGNYAYREDYAIIAKAPSSNNKSILMFTGFSFVSQVETINYFTNPEKLAQLKQAFIKKYKYIPKYYEILFKVKGYRRTSLETSILYLSEISSTGS